MAKISHGSKIDSPEGADFGAIPTDFPMRRRCEPTEHAQKAGLTAAIGPLHLHESTCLEGEIDVFEQLAIAAHAGKITSFQSGHLLKTQKSRHYSVWMPQGVGRLRLAHFAGGPWDLSQ